MTAMQPRFSRRSIAIAVVLGSVASLAIGVYAALSTRALDAAKAIPTEQSGDAEKIARIALVIGNGHYPDADAPLTQTINDARELTAALRRDRFEVDIVEDASLARRPGAFRKVRLLRRAFHVSPPLPAPEQRCPEHRARGQARSACSQAEGHEPPHS